MYAAFPALMYINASLGAPLLEPLFRLQPLRNSSNGYAAADLGTSRINMNVWDVVPRQSVVGSNYPTVSGDNLNHTQAVERLYL